MPASSACSPHCLLPRHVPTPASSMTLAHTASSHRPEHLLVLCVDRDVRVRSLLCVSQGAQGQLMDAQRRVMCGEQVSSPISASVQVARPTLEVLPPTALIRAATPTQGGYTPLHTLYRGEDPHASKARELRGQEERAVIFEGLRRQALLFRTSNKTEGKSHIPIFGRGS